MATNKPAHTVRIGYIKGSIWKNTNGDSTFYNVNIVRSYKDEKGAWQDGDSFNHADLPVVAKVADKCCDWISAQ